MIGRTYFNYKSAILTGVGDKFKWDGTMMPKHAKTGKRGGIFAGDCEAISRDGKSPDQSFELLKWVTDKEFGVALGLQTMGSTTLGGRPDGYADERILNTPQYTRQMQKAQLDSVTQIKEPSVTPYNFRAPECGRCGTTVATKITTGQAKAEPAYLRELSRQMQVPPGHAPAVESRHARSTLDPGEPGAPAGGDPPAPGRPGESRRRPLAGAGRSTAASRPTRRGQRREETTLAAPGAQ